MADNTDKPTEQIPGRIAVTDTPHAPFVYFDGAPTFGFANGIIQVTLAAGRQIPSPDSPNDVKTDAVVTTYLRCSVAGALSLKKSIEDALLLAAPTKDGSVN